MRIKNIVLGIGIIVVFALVLWQGVEAFYPSPQWDDYCSETVVPKTIIDGRGNVENPTQTECEADGGRWNNGYCDYYYYCQQEFDDASDAHAQRVFFISLIVAVIAFILGYSLLKTEPVGSALMGSGIWALFYGSVVNWRNFSDYWRFGLLLVVLILLIWIALRLNRQKKKSFFGRFRR
ncbi:hypothetical protein CO038_01910 [Candidatus Pacearchaeota archaeon CG_4_9_14_0_2_um_filter_39_13]|nr:hypothetical protein [Candidatus Pacearchaeota archaeon]OIO43135.1 MAG: hypothetical protein AUJ64_03060 [Candidatus Pacearchaeota archaeon CG1_02_39_14]PJC44703.1 MAG: hypothetical protein CO038_01910 [Candidatus Pacearchaeota archaeon CG_4_9_14_0_2_um_filter_39_13]